MVALKKANFSNFKISTSSQFENPFNSFMTCSKTSGCDTISQRMKQKLIAVVSRPAWH
jgi:hypothetical protein